MTRLTHNTLIAFVLAIPPTLVALFVSLPETYWF
jgi:hypothetical protein